MKRPLPDNAVPLPEPEQMRESYKVTTAIEFATKYHGPGCLVWWKDVLPPGRAEGEAADG